MNNNDEIALLTRLKNGDKDAYLLLYDRYHPLVYNWSIKLLKIPELAEDIVQEVFLKIWVIRERINPLQSFPAFIYRIGRNKSFSLLKKIAAEEKLHFQVMKQIGQFAESAENRLLWHQYEQMLKNAVGQLPRQRQKVFQLCRQAGKSYEEVATELGISRNTVKDHMVMAVKNIKDYFYRNSDMSFLLIFFLIRMGIF